MGVVGLGGVGGGRQRGGDEGSDGGIFLWRSVAWISRVLRGRTAVVMRRVVRGEKIPEELGSFHVGQLHGLEAVGSRVDDARCGVLDGGEPFGGLLAQVCGTVGSRVDDARCGVLGVRYPTGCLPAHLCGRVCRGRMVGGMDIPSSL